MEIPALFLLFFVLLSRDAFGRSTEGEADRKTSRIEAVEDAGEALTPWGPRSWLSERRKRSLFIESQGYGQRDQGSSVAQAPREGARIQMFPQVPSSIPVPAPPVPPPSSRPLHITRLVPMVLEFVGAPAGVNGLYSPPTTEPPTETPTPNLIASLSFALAGPSSMSVLMCASFGTNSESVKLMKYVVSL
ncbi:uncharacterized protein LOC125046606 [Penaeus chinensis]|uniref:uncharacterized protein LOC125046606 n=1 Tax=Penaeus chinensis TaxID=139456 RepID=UPI001FB71EAF|nr:uncharacterized protein LOC125046606 [Penaeus chinensis]